MMVDVRCRRLSSTPADNWNGGTYGHALYLVVPESLFIPAAKKRDDIQKQICDDLNRLHNFQNEHVAEVFLEMAVAEDNDWRQESGLLITPTRTVTPDAATRVWGSGGFRLFLSHKAEVKKETAVLKDRLVLFGVSAFVAHEDIHPTREWQDEIENALHTMDAFAALLTEDFHDSLWTDQEVGFALARGVPVIAVGLGRNPYGFLGKFQALRADWERAADGIVKLLIKHERMFNAYVKALRDCTSWEDGNVLARVLPGIEKATERQIDELVAACNGKVRNSFAISGTKPIQYGSGLIPHLHRLGPRKFVRDRDNTIAPAGQAKKRVTVKDEIPF